MERTSCHIRNSIASTGSAIQTMRAVRIMMAAVVPIKGSEVSEALREAMLMYLCIDRSRKAEGVSFEFCYLESRYVDSCRQGWYR